MARAPKDQAERTVDQLNAEIEDLKAQLADMAEEARDRGEEFVGDVKRGARRVGRRAARAYDAAVGGAEDLRDRAWGYVEDAETQVRDNPATAMGIAVGVGFILGAILTRR